MFFEVKTLNFWKPYIWSTVIYQWRHMQLHRQTSRAAMNPCAAAKAKEYPQRDLGSGTLGPIYPQGGSIQMSLTTLNGLGCRNKTWTSIEVSQSIAGQLKHWLWAESCLSHVRVIKVFSSLEEEAIKPLGILLCRNHSYPLLVYMGWCAEGKVCPWRSWRKLILLHDDIVPTALLYA